MQITLARLIRERRPERIFVELANGDHLAALQKAMTDWPLYRYVQAERPVILSREHPAPAGNDWPGSGLR